MSQYSFAWVDASETTFTDAHKREDEFVYSFSLSHVEGDFAALEVVIENPRVGLLAPSRNVWAWFAMNGEPLFFGRVIGVPDDLGGDMVTLHFIARPLDYEARRAAVAAQKATEWPYYDRVWFSHDDLDNPDNVLEARPELWHIDRVTHEVTTSDINTGDGTAIEFDEDSAFYDSVGVTYGATPYRRVDLTATVTWDQAATDAIDISDIAGVSCIRTYTGDKLVTGWPKAGASVGGGWTVSSSSIAFASNAVPTWDWKQPTGVWKFTFNDVWTMKVPNIDIGTALPPRSAGDWPEQILSIPPQTLLGSIVVGYDVSRSKKETLTFSLEADTQAIVTAPGDAAVLTLNYSSSEIVSAIDPGGVMPIGDVRRRAYFTQDRGTLSVEYLIALARARLLASARCVDVSFTVSLADALDNDVSLKKCALLRDRRLPGGHTSGKIKSYTMTGDGDSGAFLCEMTIGCSIGYGGDVQAVEGVPSYVAPDYVDSGYQLYTGVYVVPQGSGVSYTPIDGVPPNDDGVDFERLNGGNVIKSVSIGGTMEEQRAAMGKIADKPADVFDLLNTVPCTFDIRLKPLTGGPFETDYALACSPLVIPKTIDLESESMP